MQNYSVFFFQAQQSSLVAKSELGLFFQVQPKTKHFLLYLETLTGINIQPRLVDLPERHLVFQPHRTHRTRCMDLTCAKQAIHLT